MVKQSSQIQEYSTSISITLPKKDVHAKMDVFYNPLMQSNRSISILLLNSIDNKNMQLALPLAGSGIRGLRFLKELKRSKLKFLFLNDKKPEFYSYFQQQLKQNKLDTTTNKQKVHLSTEDANIFLLNPDPKNQIKDFIGYFDYIDLDPFGSPNPFLASAVSKISRNGIIAITATDTAALTGTYANVTKRKYWATTHKNYLMHELGLRILIRKVQLQGIQFDKALTPVLSYHKDHYFRIYFRSQNGKQKCDALLKQHQYFLYCSNCLHFKTSMYNNETCSCKKQYQFHGPMWTGDLVDAKILQKMILHSKKSYPKETKFLELLYNESKVNQVGFYDIHTLTKKHKIKAPKTENILKQLKAVKTHFSVQGIKTKKNLKDVEKVIKE